MNDVRFGTRLWAPLILCLVGLDVVAQHETKAAAEKALAEFREYARHRNEHVRKAAVEGLVEVDHHTVTSTLLEALKDPSEAVRDAAILCLGHQRNELGLADLIQRLWRGRKSAERLAILRAFEISRPPKAYGVVLELLDEKDWQLRLQALEVLAGYPDPEGRSLGAILPMTKDREALVRLSAMRTILALGAARGLEPGLAGLEDPDWRVRAVAVQICAKLRIKATIQPLIDLLAREKGRLQDDATAALNDICDREMPADPERWQKWWDRVKDGFKVPTAAEVAERRRRENTRRPGYDAPRPNEYPPYHGIKTRSRKMIFVLDISGSMTEVVVLDRRDREAIERFQRDYGELEVKIDIAREELINMVAGLKSYARFNIITFDARAKPWQKRLVPASGGNKNKAIKYLARLKAETLMPLGNKMKIQASHGQTNTFEALNACFGLFKGDKLDKKTFKTEADTVFFLSDGMPTTGRITQPQTLLEYIEAVNKRAQLVIHTIGFGNANKHLMERLAQSSGGQSVVIGS